MCLVGLVGIRKVDEGDRLGGGMSRQQKLDIMEADVPSGKKKKGKKSKKRRNIDGAL